MSGVDITEWGLKQLKEQKQAVSDTIKNRLVYENVMQVDKKYRAETKKLQAHLLQILKGIDLRYDEMTQVNSIGYEYIEDIIVREKDKAVLDENGKEIVERFVTGVSPLDEQLLDGGFRYGKFAVLAGESNAGKSDIAYMIVSGALKQKEKVHFHSYELGRNSLYESFYLKDKLKIDFLGTDEYHGLLSVDMVAQDIVDLKRMINIKADDGCRIFLLDSVTKIRVGNEKVGSNIAMTEIFQTLSGLAQSRGIFILGIGQKDKEAKINNSHELMGSVLQMHDVDYLFFVGYEDRENMVTSEREITMVKNRGEDVKRSIITDYDKDRHMIYYKREGGSLGQAHNKSEKWAGKIRK